MQLKTLTFLRKKEKKCVYCCANIGSPLFLVREILNEKIDKSSVFKTRGDTDLSEWNLSVTVFFSNYLKSIQNNLYILC